MPGLERVPTGSGEPQATAAACVSTRGHVGRRVSGERTKGRPHGRMTMVTANPQRACSSRLRWEPLGRFLGGPGAAMRRGYPTSGQLLRSVLSGPGMPEGTRTLALLIRSARPTYGAGSRVARVEPSVLASPSEVIEIHARREETMRILVAGRAARSAPGSLLS